MDLVVSTIFGILLEVGPHLGGNGLDVILMAEPNITVNLKERLK